MVYSIYALIDPRTRNVFYIGRTRDIDRRIAEHNGGTEQLSGLTVRQIHEAGFLPHVVVLEQCEDLDQACMSEIFWIECLKARGCQLTNAQAFSGYVERSARRAKDCDKLDTMRQVKSASKALQDVSNGVPLSKSKPWSKLELKRLRGMHKFDYSAEYIADVLSRPLSQVRNRIKTIDRKRPRRRN